MNEALIDHRAPPLTIVEAIERSLVRTPDAIAVTDDQGTLTYRELDARSRAVAAHLHGRGVGRGDVVASVLRRSAATVAGLLGVWRAGAGYMSIDRDGPEGRIRKMIADGRARVVLVDDAADAGTFGPGSVVLASALAEASLIARVVAPTERDIAYVIYTSGSTGSPKGACLEHASLLAFHRCYGALIAPRPSTRVAHFTNLAFDAHAWEIWPALAVGASVHVVPASARKDPEALARWMVSEAITSSFLPTPVGEHFLNVPALPPTLEVLGLGGDVLHAVPEYPGALRTVNVYGPTETTIVCVTHDVPLGTVMPPIGRPAAEARIYILDEDLQPVAAGATGEICIGGPFVGRGYLHHGALTAGVFVPDPFAERPGARMYRSGDLGRVREDGLLDCLGRRDHQVKIRGQRVELGEVEAALARDPAVELGIVVADVAVGGSKRLVAYAKRRDRAVGASAAKELGAHLARELPGFMVPSSIVLLDAFPLTPNGKIDRRALAASRSDAPVDAVAPPRDEREQLLVRTITELLDLTVLGIDRDFFLLGADSLFAMRAAARLRRDVHPGVTTGMIFETRTVEALSRAIAALAPSGGSGRALVRVGPRAPLSRLQERLWFLEKLDLGSNAYVIASATRLRGRLDVNALERALVEIGRRHEALRTTFEEKDGAVMQVVQPKFATKLERRDLSRVPATEQARVLREQVQRQVTTRFDLKRGPLFRSALVNLRDDEQVLVLTMHHIVSDGWSLGIVVRELTALYGAFSSNEAPALPEVAFHYGDYAAWDRGLGETDHQLAWWKQHLADAPAAIALPTDRPRPAVQKHRGASVRGDLAPPVAEQLREVGRATRATTYMVLLAGFAAVLGRLAGQESVVVATPTVQRGLPETEAMVGFFMNTFALHVSLEGSPTFEELVGRARDVSLRAHAHQDVPFERVVQELNPVRDRSRNPIAQVSLNVLNIPNIRVSLPGLEAAALEETVVGSKFDLTLYVEEREGLSFELLYDPDLFDRVRMQRMLEKLSSFLAQVARDPRARVDAVSLVLEAEHAVLPNPRAPLTSNALLPAHVAFADIARRSPEKHAIHDPSRTWSYGELDAESNQLAHLLLERGAGKDSIVPVLAARNALTICALLAVAKAGAAFMLLDAEYPPARLAVQAEYARSKVWLSTVATSPELPPQLPEYARIDLTGPSVWAAYPSTPPAVRVTASDRAYVAFTSGTLGHPKAIAGAHGPLSHFIAWHARAHALDDRDRFSVLSGLAHDPFLRDALLPLAIGASVVVPPAEVRLDPNALAAWLEATRVTVAHLTPSLGQVLALARHRPLGGLRLVAFGGEMLRADLVGAIEKLLPSCRFVNFYGATETPQAVATFEAKSDGPAVLPIGRGIEGVQLLVLTGADVLAGVDEEGEIAVRTPHLAMGYLGDAAGGFGASPFAGSTEDRIYRTGDRGLYLPEGDVLLRGRRDDQIKVRGYRVELGEVAAALSRCAGVTRATVIFEDGSLVGYFVGDGDEQAVRSELRLVLPSYMIPRGLLKLEQLPLTPNGKLDRRALPKLEQPTASPETFQGDIEETVAAVWREVLAVTAFGRHDNFFDLGGHSLLATQIALRLEDAFSIHVTVRMVFDAPTVASLAERITTVLIESASPELLRAALGSLGSDGSA